MTTGESQVPRRLALGPGAALKAAVTEAHRLLDMLLTGDMAALGLTLGESDVLTAIHVADYAPVPSEIADWLGLTGAGATGRLNTLERRGLLERRPNPADGRSVTLHLTEQGDTLATAVVEAKNTTVLNTVFDHLEPETADRIVADLQAVIVAAREILDRD